MYSKGINAMNDNHDTVKSHNASLPAKTKVIFLATGTILDSSDLPSALDWPWVQHQTPTPTNQGIASYKNL